MRIFGEEKHSLEFIVGAGSVLDQALVEQVLKPGFKENAWHYTQGKLGRFKRTYELFVQHILTGSGVQLSAAESFDGMQYKPIQSLFNKLYVRRGQAAMNVIGDLQRGTLLVDTPEQLDAIKRFLCEQNESNLKSKIHETADLKTMFDEIHKCSRTKLHGTVTAYEVIVYRVKDNSSQKERTKDGSLPHVVNVNFFIDGPQADCSRNSVIVGACELQVGVRTTLAELRSAH